MVRRFRLAGALLAVFPAILLPLLLTGGARAYPPSWAVTAHSVMLLLAVGVALRSGLACRFAIPLAAVQAAAGLGVLAMTALMLPEVVLEGFDDGLLMDLLPFVFVIPFALLYVTVLRTLWPRATLTEAGVDVTQYRRRVAAIAAVQGILLAALLVFGWGSLVVPPGRSPGQEIVRTLHEPGIRVLRAMGLCCGVGNSLVISDGGGSAHFGTLTPIGIPILAIANALAMAMVVEPAASLAAAVRAALSRRRIAPQG